MPPTKKSKTQGSNFEQEDVLQAVVVADRFDDRFSPLTDDIPLALFPVANKPLISYTLDFLVSSGVQKIFVYCCNHSGKIKEYLESSKWNSKSLQCDVTTIVSADFTSLGDVLRDIDQKALFETDFLLVHGDVIANISLEKALEEHRARRVKDRNKPLMTLLLRDCHPAHVTRSAEDDIFVVLDSCSQQVLHYQKVASSEEKRFSFPLKNFLLSGCSKFNLRYDLSDAGIAMCSPQVPQLFTDNFDYQTKEDFIRGILINEEFLGNQIHVHAIQAGQATRISTMHMYDVVSRAVIRRWAYPYVPDNNFERSAKPWSNRDKSEASQIPNIYKHLRRNVYIGSATSFGKNSSIEENSVVGHGTSIGNDCAITNSIIGCNCDVGDGVVVKDSYIWSGATMRDNCAIEKSILSNDVFLHENTTLKPGCVLSRKVEIGPNVTLDEDMVIHIQPDEDAFAESEDIITRKETNPDLVGSKGRGVLWSSRDPYDSDEELEEVMEGIWGMSLAERDRNHPAVSNEESTESEASSDESVEQDLDSDDEDNSVNLFFKEVKDSLYRGVEENVKCDNLILEINSSKHAYNVTMQDIVKSVTKATFEIADARSSGGALFPALKKVFSYLAPVFVNYNKTSQAQIDCLHEIECYCLRNKPAFDCLIKVLMFLYENDILAEELIMHWHKKTSTAEFANEDLTPEKLRLSVTKFIDWLQEAEEESSEEDS